MSGNSSENLNVNSNGDRLIDNQTEISMVSVSHSSFTSIVSNGTVIEGKIEESRVSNVTEPMIEHMEVDKSPSEGVNGGQLAATNGSLDDVACSLGDTSLKGEAVNVIGESVVTEQCDNEFQAKQCEQIEVDKYPSEGINGGQIGATNGSLDGIACSLGDTSFKGEVVNVIGESVVTEQCENEFQAKQREQIEVDKYPSEGVNGGHVAGMSRSLDGVACSIIDTSSKGESVNVIGESVVTVQCENEFQAKQCKQIEVDNSPSEGVNGGQVDATSGILDGVACSKVDTSLKGEAVNVIRDSVVTEQCETEFQPMEVDCSPAFEHQNVDTGISELAISPGKVDQLMEVDVETKGSDGSCKHDTDESKISNMGSIIIDLDASFGAGSKKTDGKDGFSKTIADDNKKAHPVGKDMSKPRKLAAGTKQIKESEFAVSDLVWGKIKSHPWWPGQIFEPSFASEKAMKHYKKGRLLVAYFGDQTFAWNEPSSLKPFKVDFSDLEKQSDTLVFQDAVYYALAEFSRQVELGLSCSCTPEDIYAARKFQTVNNTGIKEEVCKTDVVDRQFGVTSFHPGDLLKYIKVLALGQGNGGDRLKLVIAQAQLVAFNNWKGYLKLPEFHAYVGLSDENEEGSSIDEGEACVDKGEKCIYKGATSVKRQVMLEVDLQFRTKQRSLTDLEDLKNSSSYSGNGLNDGISEKGLKKSASGKKRKAKESPSDGSMIESRNKKVTPKSLATPSPTSRGSGIGERILGIAKQLAGSPPILKLSPNRDRKSAVKGYRRSKKLHEVDVITLTPAEMHSQLCLAAKDPIKGYSFLTTIIDFFTEFRNSINLDRESYVHEAVSDSEKDNSTLEHETPHESPSISNSKKDASPVDRRSTKQQVPGKPVSGTPTALILKFTDADSIPLESDLNNIFRPIGSLEESQTEIMRKSRKAKVVFYRSSDADQAFRKYVKFKDFGPALVSYELQPATPTKSLFSSSKRRKGADTSVKGITN